MIAASEAPAGPSQVGFPALAQVPRGARWLFIGLVVASVVPPFVPLAGPFSVDDVLPIAAVLIAAPVIAMRRTPPRLDATAVAFGALILLACLSSSWNAETPGDFLRLFGRSGGRMAFYLALIVGTRGVLEGQVWARRALVAFAGVATLEAAFCAFAYLAKYSGPYGLGVTGFAHWSVLEGKTRVQGTFGGQPGAFEVVSSSANFLAAYLVMSIPITAGLGWMTSGVRRAGWWASVVLQAIVLYLTYTRAGLLALGGGVLVTGWLLGRRGLAVLVLVLGVGGAFLSPTVRTKLLHEKHDRYALYYAAAAIIADHPAVGIGDGNYPGTLHRRQRYFQNPMGSATTTSHNSMLLSAAHHGALGGVAHFALYVLAGWFLIGALRRCDARTRVLLAATIGGLAGYLVQDQANDLAYVPKVATQAWFLFGVAGVLGLSPGGSEDAE